LGDEASSFWLLLLMSLAQLSAARSSTGLME
jgi:hypothetical protein